MFDCLLTSFYNIYCCTFAAEEWQPMLDLDPLFDVHSLAGLAATIEYDF